MSKFRLFLKCTRDLVSRDAAMGPLGEKSDQLRRKAKSLSDFTHDSPGAKSPKCGHRSDMCFPIFTYEIVAYIIASAGLKIDIDIRSFTPIRREKTVKVKIMSKGIYPTKTEAICHNRINH